jgi:NDP-sugar pyrophosphorylase family protein
VSASTLQHGDDSDPQLEPIRIDIRPDGRVSSEFENAFYVRVLHPDGRPYAAEVEVLLVDGTLGEKKGDPDAPVRLLRRPTDALGIVTVRGRLGSEVLRLEARVLDPSSRPSGADEDTVRFKRRMRFVSFAGAVMVSASTRVVQPDAELEVLAHGLSSRRPVFVDVYDADGAWIDTAVPPFFGVEEPRRWRFGDLREGVLQLEAYSFAHDPGESTALARVQIVAGDPERVESLRPLVALHRTQLHVPRVELDWSSELDRAYLGWLETAVLAPADVRRARAWLLGTLPVSVYGPPLALQTHPAARPRRDGAAAPRMDDGDARVPARRRRSVPRRHDDHDAAQPRARGRPDDGRARADHRRPWPSRRRARRRESQARGAAAWPRRRRRDGVRARARHDLAGEARVDLLRPRAMILAAGLGTRLGEMGRTKPKPMLPVCGAPLVRWSALWLRHHGVGDIAINLHHLGEQIQAELGDGSALGLRIAYSHEEGMILGTGGGLRHARHLIDDGAGTPIVVVNGKILVDLDLQAVLRAHVDSGAEATMVLRADPEAAKWGSLQIDAQGRIVRLLDYATPARAVAQPASEALMFTGVHVLSPRFLDRIPAEGEQCVIRTAYRSLFHEGRGLHGFVTDRYWWEHSTPQRYIQGVANVLDGVVSLPFAEGPVRGVDPTAVVGPGARIEPPVWVGPRVTIGRDAVVGPHVQLGAGSTVRPGARVVSSVAWDGAVIEGDVRDEVVTA